MALIINLPVMASPDEEFNTHPAITLSDSKKISRNNHQSGIAADRESDENKPNNPKNLPNLPLDLRLAGTFLNSPKTSFALIVDQANDKQDRYTVGDIIKGAKIHTISKDYVLFEMENSIFILKVQKGGVSTPVSTGKNGPVTSYIATELPFFEPVSNKTGPSVDPNKKYEKLPAFVPVDNLTGPASSTPSNLE